MFEDLSTYDQANIWRALGVLLLVSMALVPRIRGIGVSKTIKMALSWVIIFGALILLVSVWPQFRAALDPAAPIADGHEVRVSAREDGHFYVRAIVNGQSVLFMVDTGASDIVLTRDTAERLGFDLGRLAFDGVAETANGLVRSADVRLATIEVGSIHRENLRASVNGGALNQNLLGMRFLRALDRWRVEGENLILTG